MTEAAVNLTDDPGPLHRARHRPSGVPGGRVGLGGSRASFFTVVVWRDQTGHVAWSPAHGQPATTEGRPRSWQDPGPRTRGRGLVRRRVYSRHGEAGASAILRRLALGSPRLHHSRHMKRHIIAPPMTHDPLSRWMPSTGRSPSTVVLAGLPLTGSGRPPLSATARRRVSRRWQRGPWRYCTPPGGRSLVALGHAPLLHPDQPPLIGAAGRQAAVPTVGAVSPRLLDRGGMVSATAR